VSEDDGWQRYVDAANALGQLARDRVEEIARDLLSTGESEGDHARQWTEDLLERSRSVVDDVVEVVRAEVTKQLEVLGLGSPEDLLRRLTETFAKPGRGEGPGPHPDVVAIDASSVTAPAPRSGAEKSEATAAASKQRAPKPKGADKKKAAKKQGASKKGAPHTAERASQKTAATVKSKKSAGRGT